MVGVFKVKFIDISGQKFGKLTVIERGEDYVRSDGAREVRWKCKCDCGNPDFVLVRGTLLRNGKTKSCGCLRKEKMKQSGENNKGKHNESSKTYNIYDLSGDYGIGYTNDNQEFYFDLEDYNLIKNYCWHIGTDGYVEARSLDFSNRIVLMHRIVMGLDFGDSRRVDHILHCTNDNRKKYLRIATGSQNLMNSKMFSNNTSGYKGVYFDKDRNKWRSAITIDQHTIRLGRHDRIEDAVIERKQAEEKYFKEYNYNYYNEEDFENADV